MCNLFTLENKIKCKQITVSCKNGIFLDISSQKKRGFLKSAFEKHFYKCFPLKYLPASKYLEGQKQDRQETVSFKQFTET